MTKEELIKHLEPLAADAKILITVMVPDFRLMNSYMSESFNIKDIFVTNDAAYLDSGLTLERG
jgi:hypothetical protein